MTSNTDDPSDYCPTSGEIESVSPAKFHRGRNYIASEQTNIFLDEHLRDENLRMSHHRMIQDEYRPDTPVVEEVTTNATPSDIDPDALVSINIDGGLEQAGGGLISSSCDEEDVLVDGAVEASVEISPGCDFLIIKIFTLLSWNVENVEENMDRVNVENRRRMIVQETIFSIPNVSMLRSGK